ncbi:DUF3563 family protein [Paraburkholderia fungorum]
MIILIFYLLNAWLDAIEYARREAWLADAKDLCEVERRMRTLENGDSYR